MPLSFLTVSAVNTRELEVDAFVCVTGIDAEGVGAHIFKPADEAIIRSVCDKFAYLKDIQSSKVNIDTAKWQDVVRHSIITNPLAAKHIINTVAPAYRDGKHGEETLLRSCYIDALNLAKSYGCKSITFPLISSEVYGYPQEEALTIATYAIRDWLISNEMDIALLVFNKKAFLPPKLLLNEINDFIENNYEFKCNNIYKGLFGKIRAFNDKYEIEAKDHYSARELNYNIYYSDPVSEEQRKSDFNRLLEESFSSTLMRIIEENAMTATEVYKRANIDRRLFSKIRSDKKYMPSKRTAVALAVALELSFDETKFLLKRAGFTFSRSLLFDVIIEYFIIQGNYDVYEINNVLFSYDLPVLGG
ncbi:MAG: RNase III inhibitor [Denitrovibrio sp.]|nr:MAG: RNase III inhibitor [Denitrovibrio sp.]